MISEGAVKHAIAALKDKLDDIVLHSDGFSGKYENSGILMGEIEGAIGEFEQLASCEIVPEGHYMTKHKDGLICYTSRTNQLSVSKLAKRMNIFVGTLPDGWRLMRPIPPRGE